MTASKIDKKHVIDPDGEVKFLLENANAPFAVWDKEEEEKISKPTPRKSAKQPPKKKAKLDDDGASKNQNADTDAPRKQGYISIRVSAKHLMLASPVLKKTLSGGWKESELFAKQGHIDIPVFNWDLEAFLLFLRILHCQHKNIPSTVTLEMIAKIAVLADYYACKDSISFFANLWIDQLKGDFPTKYSRDLMLWLFISWFFAKGDLLENSTSIAMTQSAAPIANLGLPIPASVLGTLNKKREREIQQVVSRLKKQRDVYLDDGWYCSLGCCAMLLGALEKQMHMNGLALPGPEAPFHGIDYETLVTTVHAFKTPKWAAYDPNRYANAHTCIETTRGYQLLQFETVLKGYSTIRS